MKKYIYQLNKYINKDELADELDSLVTCEHGIDEISYKTLSYLNIDEIELKNQNVSVRIIDQKKNISSYLLSSLDFISDESLKKAITNILNNSNVLDKLNNMKNFNYNEIKDMLIENDIVISDENLIKLIKVLNEAKLCNLNETICNFNPIKRIGSYKKDYVFYKIEMEKDDNLFSTLTKFEGEIYDSLNFSSDYAAKTFQKENNIEDELLEDVVSYIHFNGESTINDWYNSMTIIKYKTGCIYIDYGERLFVQNIKNNSSINSKEIDSIIDEFKNRDIDNEFIRYAVNELNQLKIMLNRKKIAEKMESLSVKKQEKLELYETINSRNNSLKEISKIYNNRNYGNNKTIFVEINVLSNKPITFEKNKTMILK